MTVVMNDGDGTKHRFGLSTSPGEPAGEYKSPAGVFVYLRDVKLTLESHPGPALTRFIATRPDRVSSYFAADGHLLQIRDAEGNTLKFNYDCFGVNAFTGGIVDNLFDDPATPEIEGAEDPLDPCKKYAPQAPMVPTTRLMSVVDSADRAVTFGYFSVQEAVARTQPTIAGRLKTMTDHEGVITALDYTAFAATKPIARLATITRASGTSDARTTTYTYGETDVATTVFADESGHVTDVQDERGGHTEFTYVGAPLLVQPSRVDTIRDRSDSADRAVQGALQPGFVDLDYPSDGETEVTDELGATSNYTWQTGTAPTAGRTLTQTSAEGIAYSLAWSDYNTVTELRELTAAGGQVHATWTYQHDEFTGYVQSATEPGAAGSQRAATKIWYTNDAAYDSTPELRGRVADIWKVQSPRGTATSDAVDDNDFLTTYTYDVAGSRPWRLLNVTAPINEGTGSETSVTSMTYYANGDLRSQTDGRGLTTGYSAYDHNGIAERIHQPVCTASRQCDTTMDSATFVESGANMTAAGTELQVDQVGRVIRARDARASGNVQVTSYRYNRLGEVLQETKPWNTTQRRATRYAYDGNGNPTQMVQHIGYTPSAMPFPAPAASTAGDEAAEGQVTPDAGLAGAATSWQYTPNDLERISELPDNNNSNRQTRTVYDRADRSVESVAPRGEETTGNTEDFTTRKMYDADGRVTRQQDAEGRPTCFYYDPQGNLTIQVSARGLTGSACPGAAPANYRTVYAYNRSHQVTSTTNVRGRTSQVAYDEEGNSSSVTNHLGEATEYSYDPAGRILKQTSVASPVCATASNQVTGSGACTQTVNAQAVTETVYDPNGNPLRQNMPRQAELGGTTTDDLHYTESAYDSYNRPVRQQMPTQNRTGATVTALYIHKSYDALGRMCAVSMQTQQSSPGGNLCEATSTSAVPQAQTTQFTYWADGTVNRKQDHTTGTDVTSTFGVNGQVQKRTEHGDDLDYTYYPDTSPHTRASDDSRIEDSVYTYDVDGNIDAITNNTVAANVTKTLDYGARDQTGLPESVTGFDNSTTNYEYDPIDGRLTSRTATMPGTGGATKLAQLTYGTTQATFDLITKATLSGGVGQTSDLSAEFTYDELDRLNTVQRDADTVAVTNYDYLPSGAMELMSTTEPAGSCTGADKSKCLQHHAYRYDLGGNIRRIDDVIRKAGQTTPTSRTRWYTYDARNRMTTDRTGDAFTDPARTYKYDSLGRLDLITAETGATDPSEDHDYFQDRPALQSTQALSGSKTSTTTNTWTEGNLTTTATVGIDARTVTNTYDALNRMHTTASGGTTLTINYDPLDRRYSQSTGALGGTTNYEYDATGLNPYAERSTETGQPALRWLMKDPQGRQIAELRDTTAGGGILAQTDSRYMLTDHTGSTETVLDGDADTSATNVKATLDYDASGRLKKPDEAGSTSSDATASPIPPPGGQPDPAAETTKTPYQYTGKRYDPISGSTHHQARNYNPNLRTWVETDQYLDPLQDLGLSVDPMTMDRTLYAAGNPINMIDEDGHRVTYGPKSSIYRYGYYQSWQSARSGYYPRTAQRGVTHRPMSPEQATTWRAINKEAKTTESERTVADYKTIKKHAVPDGACVSAGASRGVGGAESTACVVNQGGNWRLVGSASGGPGASAFGKKKKPSLSRLAGAARNITVGPFWTNAETEPELEGSFTGTSVSGGYLGSVNADYGDSNNSDVYTFMFGVGYGYGIEGHRRYGTAEAWG